MRHIYINRRLYPLTVAAGSTVPRTWIFSLGQEYLLLTPPRFKRIASRLPLADARFARLLRLIRRHSPAPEDFCRPLGLIAEAQLRPGEYPPASCPSCDRLHHPHPEDAGMPCPNCSGERRAPCGGILRDRLLDQRARRRLQKADPGSFTRGALSPNWRLNQARRLQRDWEVAINRILMGRGYREVAREFECSVGVLHKRVQESKWWENN